MRIVFTATQMMVETDMYEQMYNKAILEGADLCSLGLSVVFKIILRVKSAVSGVMPVDFGPVFACTTTYLALLVVEQVD